MSELDPQRSIRITLGLDGTVTIEALGFQGQSCKEATAPFVEALGVILSDTPKPELTQPAATPGVIQARKLRS